MLTICLWIILIAISSKNKMFVNYRANLLIYFSREAYVNYMGNSFGTKFAMKHIQAPTSYKNHLGYTF